MDLAKVMATKRRMLSKALWRAKLQIDKNQIDDLKISLVKLAELFEEFDIAQEGYADTLESFDEIEEATEYFDQVITKYGETRKEIILFLQNDARQRESCFSIPPAFNIPIAPATSQAQGTDPPMKIPPPNINNLTSQPPVQSIATHSTEITGTTPSPFEVTSTYPVYRTLPLSSPDPEISTFLPSNTHSANSTPLRVIGISATRVPQKAGTELLPDTGDYHRKSNKQHAFSQHSLKAEDGQMNRPKANGIKVGEPAASSIGTNTPEQRPCTMPQRLVRYKKYTGIRRYMNTGGTVLLLLLIFVEWTCLLQSPCTTRGLNIATDYAWMHRNEPIVHFEYGEVFRHALPYIYNMVLLLWKYCSGDQLSEVHQLQECLYKRHIPLNVT